MNETAHSVRIAIASDISCLLRTAAAVQNRIARSGSVQQVTGYTERNVVERIQCQQLYALEVSGLLLGSAFVEPATSRKFPQLDSWKVVPEGCTAYFLSGLMISPIHQGQGWGRVLLDGICHHGMFASPTALVLDCWAGNLNLRQFYAEAKFEFQGEFPEEDYRVAVFRRLLKTQP